MASLNMTLAGIDNMSLADKKKAHAYLNSSKIAKYMQDYQALNRVNDELHADRNKFRDHFTRRFKWYIELLGNNKYPTMTWLVTEEAKFLSTVKPFSW